MARSRKATVADVHTLAMSMPEVEGPPGPADDAAYTVRGKSFVFFRSPRPDAVDPETGERYTDVIVFWVQSEADKEALVQADSPFFTTPHWNGFRAVLLRASRIGELSRDELAEIVQDAWLTRAPRRLANAWLSEQEAGS